MKIKKLAALLCGLTLAVFPASAWAVTFGGDQTLSPTGDNHIRVHESVCCYSNHWFHIEAYLFDHDAPALPDIHAFSGSFQMLTYPKSKSQSFDVYNGTNHTPCFYLNNTDDYRAHIYLIDETAGFIIADNQYTFDYRKSTICP